MKNDVKSNYTVADSLAAASRNAGAANGTAVDHASGTTCTFHISVGSVGAAGTLDAKVQYSDDNSTFTDYPASDPAGNSSSITQLTAAGTAKLHVVVPRGRYSRVVATVGTNAVVFGVTSILGPLRHVAP